MDTTRICGYDGYVLFAMYIICICMGEYSGAHTLGRAKSENTGFGDVGGNPWVFGWGLLDNEWFHYLLDDGLRTARGSKLEYEQKLNPGGSGKYEWRSWNDRHFMLNSDIAVLRDIDGSFRGRNGEVTCTYDSCSDNTITKPFVQEFADDNQAWLTVFGAAFHKMIKTGYDTVNANPNDLVVMAEKWYIDELMATNAPTTSTAAPPPTRGNQAGKIVSTEGNYCDSVSTFSQIIQMRQMNRKELRRRMPDMLSEWAEENDECLYTEGVTNYVYDTEAAGKGQYNVTVLICCDADSDNAVLPSSAIPSNFETGDELMNTDLDTEEVTDGGGDKFDPTLMIILIVAGLGLCVCVIGGSMFYKKKRHNKAKYEKKRTSVIGMMRANKATEGQKHIAAVSDSHWTQPSGDTAEVDALNA